MNMTIYILNVFFAHSYFVKDCYKNLMSNVLCLKICDVCRNKYIVKKYG